MQRAHPFHVPLQPTDSTRGSVVVRALFPFPDRTTTSPVSKSRSLTRNRNPSSSRIPAAVEQPRDQLRRAAQLPQQPPDLFPRAPRRERAPVVLTYELRQPRDFLTQHVVIQKENRC